MSGFFPLFFSRRLALRSRSRRGQAPALALRPAPCVRYASAPPRAVALSPLLAKKLCGSPPLRPACGVGLRSPRRKGRAMSVGSCVRFASAPRSPRGSRGSPPQRSPPPSVGVSLSRRRLFGAGGLRLRRRSFKVKVKGENWSPRTSFWSKPQLIPITHENQENHVFRCRSREYRKSAKNCGRLEFNNSNFS
jgi:hypothetical protein